MSGYARHFDVNRFDMDRKDFDREKDTARPMFFVEQRVDPVTNQLIDVDMVKVQSPGEHLNVFGGAVTEEHKRRWPDEYRRFKAGEKELDGTPLSKWPAVASNVEFMSELRLFGFQTVEDLAKMPDSAIRLFHGADVWRLKARKYMDEQRAVLEAKKADEKDAQIAMLMERLSKLEQSGVAPVVKNKGGRPRKTDEQTQAA